MTQNGVHGSDRVVAYLDTKYHSIVLRGRVLFQYDEALKKSKALGRGLLLLDRFPSPLPLPWIIWGTVDVLTGSIGRCFLIWRTCESMNQENTGLSMQFCQGTSAHPFSIHIMPTSTNSKLGEDGRMVSF
ncbi:hypothetical protein MPTK1_5g14480 [Marchantia polymorpha subsp. ruderalis]|uniref:Uncharacterized protein n=2 Tax=Marchantia polymorpha TaxID=3197 RepID=A0AAF6BIC5_MARPO|nr:hypothetical protein MARPO_0032s0141 [Marchantia polymorpha]BBN11759.1 hypothetical protein Mp_5g14480 [Marchantia polymorpha subsp. ruderalis]|eukprot:PTQ41978.1 hypothetical protein MARPO_0032s0141 [Marchantia polymorpha]